MLLLALLIVTANQAAAQVSSDSCFAAFVVSFAPGNTNAGTIVENEGDVSLVTGSTFGRDHSISLGFGGEIIIGFSSSVPLGSDVDLLIDERDESPSAEKVNVFVSASLDDPFIQVGENISGNGLINIESAGLSEFKYVKLVDASDTADFSNDNANGYDIDRVVSLQGCGNLCEAAVLPTASLENTAEEACLNTEATVSLTGDGPWKLGYTNGSGLTWVDVASATGTIPLTLEDQMWLTWVTDNNGCTAVINESDTLQVAPVAEAYIRASYVKNLTEFRECNGGGGRLVPLVVRGNSPWKVIYSAEKNGVTSTDTLNFDRGNVDDDDIYYWRLPESGKYELVGLEDDCGEGTIIREINTVRTDFIELVDVASAQFVNSDTLCNNGSASLEVALSGTAPWQLTWEVGGVEYSESNITSPVFSLPLEVSGQYTLKSVRGSATCEGIILEDSAVTVRTPASAQLFIKSGTICNTDEETIFTVKLNGSAPYTFAYLLNDEVVDTVVTELETYELAVEEAGIYRLAWIQNACGIGTVGGELEVGTASPTFNAIAYETVSQSCNTVTLSVQADSIDDNFTYEWYSGGQLVGQESTVVLSEIIGSNVDVSLVTKLGLCTDTVMATIPVEAIGTGDVGRFSYRADGETTCDGQRITFSSDSVNTAFTYQWKVDGELVGDEENFSSQLLSGSYSVQMIINNGECQYSSQQQIQVLENNRTELAEFSYTIGEAISCSTYPVTFEATAIDSEPTYRWLVDSEEVSREASFNYDMAPGKSEITMIATLGECTYTSKQTVIIEGESLPNSGAFDYEMVLLNCSQQSLSARAMDLGEEVQYQWWVNDTLVSEQEQFSTILFPGENLLRLTTQVGGCRYEVEEVVVVASTESLVNVPNALSPQAVQPDDQVAKVYGRCFAEEGFLFQIVDRWGGIAYQTSSTEEATNQGWNGGDYPSGIYTYVLRGRFDSGSTFQKQGKITLIK